MNTNNENIIHQEVAKTLDLLQKNEDAKVNPYFYTRLSAKLNGASQINETPDFFDRVRFGIIIPVICALLLVFNIITIAIKYNAADSETAKTERIESLRNEYNSITGGYGN